MACFSCANLENFNEVFSCLNNYTEEEKISRSIDKQLRRELKNKRHEAKILLRGVGECGKTTVFKQLRLMYTAGFKNHEKDSFLITCRRNIMQSIQELMNGMDILGMSYESSVNEEHAKVLRPFTGQCMKMLDDNLECKISEEMISRIATIWKDAEVQKCYKRTNEYPLMECAQYFLNNLQILRDDHQITNDDILHARQVTKKACEETFDVSYDHIRLVLKMIDIGGQRKERGLRWLQCFSEITSILYIAALSDFSLFSLENQNLNRLEDSLADYTLITNSSFTQNVNFIVFLNKEDVFQERLKFLKLSDFPATRDYTGNNSFNDGKEFIKSKFESICSSRAHYHFTCATDTTSLKKVFYSVAIQILQYNMNQFSPI